MRAVSPFLGPPSDYAVVKMIPNERLPPRNLHRVRVDKTQATLKWQPPYDAPNAPLVQFSHPVVVIKLWCVCVCVFVVQLDFVCIYERFQIQLK